jgi:twitching motility two-component system response regulator PilG
MLSLFPVTVLIAEWNPLASWQAGKCQEEGQPMSTLVMVIDDSPVVRKIIEVTLRREGMEVISYPDGVEALRAVTTRHLNRLPDLLFLDLELPKMNGFEIARHLRSKPQWNRTVIVILSRHDGIVDRIKARLAGTQAYLTKPCTRQMLVEVVMTNLRRQAALP